MIGIFIGSFNPPTKAHYEICLKLQKKYSKIILVPVNSTSKHLVSIYDRINMLRVYTHKNPFLDIDDIMKNYSYFNFRVLDLLKNKYQKIDIIIGSDLLKNIKYFDNYEYILKNYHFIILTRDNHDVQKIIKENYLKYQDSFEIMEYHNNLSSSLVRERIKNKDNYKDFLDKDINEYIMKHHLYV